MLPPIPSWDAMHVLVVHFPIVLFVLTPLALALALVCSKLRREFTWLAFGLMALGLLATFVATSTGEEAGNAAVEVAAAKATFNEHEELGETVRTVFLCLTILFALGQIGPRILKKEISATMQTGFLVVLLAGSLVGAALVAKCAHEGGKLVHVYGVHARIEPALQPPRDPAAKHFEDEDDDD